MRHLFSLLPLLLAACSSLGGDRFDVTRDNASQHLASARAEIANGQEQDALERLIALRSTRGLAPDQRVQTEALLDETARGILEELERSERSSKSFLKFYVLDLSTRIKARAGIAAAERLFREDRPVSAFKQIRRVERELPSHPERARAGELLGRVGLDMVRRGGRYRLLFRYASRGREALEYLVLRYPFDARCPEAYAELVELYHGRRDFDLAIERAEDLLIYHPQSSYAVSTQALLPRLRMDRLERDDYDRAELVQAERELGVWLERYGGRAAFAQTEEGVQRSLKTCRGRLAQHDLNAARFYDRVDEPQGVRLHAERALENARAAQAQEAIADATRLLERHAEASAPAQGSASP